MQQTMTDYADVFKAPTTLPPLRDIDHHIPLKDDTQPINVRPYRYAYFQKAEIEKQETHIEHVRTTLDILRQHQFFIKESKYDFGKQELEYLSHIVTHQGVKVDNKKIEAMVSWPQPANVTDLRGFLGLTGYYRKFVRGYGLLARPLTNLLKREVFSGLMKQHAPSNCSSKP
ncbi:hypothetical protein UlMin_026640 [Ulmus minor]